MPFLLALKLILFLALSNDLTEGRDAFVSAKNRKR